MGLTRDTISNFIGGVSQQTDKLLYPNQSKELINNLTEFTFCCIFWFNI